MLLDDVIRYVQVPEAIVRDPELDETLVSSINCNASSVHDDARFLANPPCCKEKSVFAALIPEVTTEIIIATPIAEIKIKERRAIYPLGVP